MMVSILDEDSRSLNHSGVVSVLRGEKVSILDEDSRSLNLEKYFKISGEQLCQLCFNPR